MKQKQKDDDDEEGRENGLRHVFISDWIAYEDHTKGVKPTKRGEKMMKKEKKKKKKKGKEESTKHAARDELLVLFGVLACFCCRRSLARLRSKMAVTFAFNPHKPTHTHPHPHPHKRTYLPDQNQARLRFLFKKSICSTTTAAAAAAAAAVAAEHYHHHYHHHHYQYHYTFISHRTTIAAAAAAEHYHNHNHHHHYQYHYTFISYRPLTLLLSPFLSHTLNTHTPSPLPSSLSQNWFCFYLDNHSLFQLLSALPSFCCCCCCCCRHSSSGPWPTEHKIFIFNRRLCYVNK